MKLIIDVWTDYVCPFCYIGKRELESAIRQTNLEEIVELNYRAYELNPTAPTSGTMRMSEFFERKGFPKAQMKAAAAELTKRGAPLGIVFNHDDMMYQNTKKAHRVAKYAKTQGIEKAFHEQMFHAVFTDNLVISDTDELVKLTNAIGLNEEQVRQVAEDPNAYLAEVEADIKKGLDYGLRGAPFFVFNEKYALSGAQTVDGFAGALEKLKEELGLNPKLQVIGQDGAACGPDGCDG